MRQMQDARCRLKRQIQVSRCEMQVETSFYFLSLLVSCIRHPVSVLFK